MGCGYFGRELSKYPDDHLYYVKFCYHVKAPGMGNMGDAHDTHTPTWCPEIKRKRKLTCKVK